MTKRIFRAIYLVALAVLLASGVLIMGVLYDYFTARYQTQLKNDAVYISQAVNSNGISYLEALKTEGADSDRITLVDTDGTVLYDSEVDAATMENHADRAEIAAAFANGTGESERYSKTLLEQTYNYAVRLDNGMVLRVSNRQYSVATLLVGMLRPIVVILLLAIIGSFLLALRLSQSIVRPINSLNLERPEAEPPYEELQPLLDRISAQQRKIQEQMRELQRKQQEFTTITESMNEGFLTVDRNTNILSYNASALQLLGADKAQSRQSVLTLNRSEGFRRAVDLALRGEHNEQSMQMDDKHFQLIANPVYQEEELIGAVLIILDVTEKEQREHLRHEFTANVSHELKTPLTSISGFAEIIRGGLVKSEDISRFADKIFSEAQRLITLVGDIIKVSQMDENSIPEEKQPVDMFEIAESVIMRLEQTAKKRQIMLDVQGEHAKVMGVPQILDEMVLNVCDNAVKYNREHGSVIVTVTRNGRNVEVEIADTGIGIPPNECTRVFERFYRVDKSHSKEIGGTGLGLSIVKHGAAYHGATISLTSELDKGTVITMTFESAE